MEKTGGSGVATANLFLAVQNSSIGDLVPWLVRWLGTTNNQRVHNSTEWPQRLVIFETFMTIFDHIFWWQFLMTILDDNFWWQFFYENFDDNFLWQFLMTILDDNFWWHFLMSIFDDHFWWQFLMTIFYAIFDAIIHENF